MGLRLVKATVQPSWNQSEVNEGEKLLESSDIITVKATVIRNVKEGTCLNTCHCSNCVGCGLQFLPRI